MKKVYIALIFDKDKMPMAYTPDADTYEDAVELGAQGLDEIENAVYFKIEQYYTKGATA